MPEVIPQCVPTVLTAGDTWEFDITSSVYVPSSYNSTFYLSQGNAVPISANGSNQGNNVFRYTVAAASNAGLSEGTYQWLIRNAEIATPTHIHTIQQGEIYVLPNLAVAQDPTFAQTMVDLLQTALETLGATTEQSVSFNGQSFTQANIEQYRRDIAYWESRVIAENNKRSTARGKGASGGVRYGFEPSGPSYYSDPQNPFYPVR